jgi:hypothetical protein
MCGHVARMGETRNVCRILVGKSLQKRPRAEVRDNIKMNPREICCADRK